jgi:hypothetical protein
LLLFDGHDSHNSRNWFTHCLENKIIPALLVPHTSHLTQLLDIGVFSPLNKALSRTLAPLLITQVCRIRTPKWLSAFIKAHNLAFTTQNIKSTFSGAGFVPFNPEKVLNRVPLLLPLPPSASDTSPRSTPTTLFHKEILTSSLIDGNATYKANATVMELMASGDTVLVTPTRKYIAGLAKRNN